MACPGTAQGGLHAESSMLNARITLQTATTAATLELTGTLKKCNNERPLPESPFRMDAKDLICPVPHVPRFLDHRQRRCGNLYRGEEIRTGYSNHRVCGEKSGTSNEVLGCLIVLKYSPASSSSTRTGLRQHDPQHNLPSRKPSRKKLIRYRLKYNAFGKCMVSMKGEWDKPSDDCQRQFH